MRVRHALLLLFLGSTFPGCPAPAPSPGPAADVRQQLFAQVLANRPSPAEARVVGSRIDTMFAAIEQADAQYVQEVTSLKWGDIYSPKALNNPRALHKLKKTNSRALELALRAFAARQAAYDSALKDLGAMAEGSLFAKAMLAEVRHRYEEPETGLAAVEHGMKESTIEKMGTLDKKLDLLLGAEGKYKVLENGQVAAPAELANSEFSRAMAENVMQHNQCTAAQRRFGEYFINNRRQIVARFRELSAG